jgi:hypothetical protein
LGLTIHAIAQVAMTDRAAYAAIRPASLMY